MIGKKTKINMSSSGLTRRSRNREEQGRSMVEMLGVLAIVGVLSVGGIAGYTYAMNRYYTNELLAGASERAVLVTAQLASGREPNLNEFAHYPNVGGTFGNAFKITGGFAIPVSDVKGAVCKNLIQATEGTDISIANDDTDLSDATCDDENPNDLAFVFETGIGGNSDKPTDSNTCDPACEDNKLCIGGICVGTKRSCPFFVEYCDEDYETGEKNCNRELSDACHCYEEWPDDSEEPTYICPTEEELAECPQTVCETDEDSGEEYCSLTRECELICNELEPGNFECENKTSPSECIYNSDCNDWCQDKDGDCFCLISVDEGVMTGGECALVDDYSSTNPFSRMTWFAANNWCQAKGSKIYSLTTEVLDNGEIVDADDIRSNVCCEVGNCRLDKPTSIQVNFTLNGQPAKVECSSNGLVRIHEGYGEFTPLCD